MKYWDFRKIVAIEEPVFNNVLEKFYKMGIEGLVRENIQNSLDGKLKECNEPVRVTIRTGEISISDIPGIEEVEKHIYSLKGHNSYVKETIKHMKKSLEESQIRYISFEDENTKGLTGAKKGELGGKDDSWAAYAYKKGVHFTEADQYQESHRGGSYGIGKIASNAASDIYMMFFANCDEDNNQHIGGTVQLIEHELDGCCYRSSGYFTKMDSDYKYIPFENTFSGVFTKNTRGLKIIVPFLRKEFCDNNRIIQSICDNFFVAILTKTLVVNVNGKNIDHESLKDIITDNHIYPEQSPAEMNKVFTPLYVQTYTECPFTKIQIDSKEDSYYFKLFIQYHEKIRKGRMAIVRGIGMKIEDAKIKGNATQPFNAVMIPVSEKEDKYLKMLENESHTELSCEHIKDAKQRADAKRFINNISKELAPIIALLIRNSQPTEGIIDTSDIIYSVESNFKKELTSQISTVQLTKGENGKKELVKTEGRKRKRRYNSSEKKKKKRKGLGDILHEILNKGESGDEKLQNRFLMKPENVKRLVRGNNEKLFFDFTLADQYTGENSCHIGMVVIDGTGRECSGKNEFIMKDNYSRIVDTYADQQCEIKNNRICGVSIKDGKVSLDMTTTARYNPNLKFTYYVEI